jgi:hypothetical protein
MRVIVPRAPLPLEPPLLDALDCWPAAWAPLVLCRLEELALRARVLRALDEPLRVLRLPDARGLRVLPELRELPLLPELPLLRELLRAVPLPLLLPLPLLRLDPLAF